MLPAAAPSRPAEDTPLKRYGSHGAVLATRSGAGSQGGVGSLFWQNLPDFGFFSSPPQTPGSPPVASFFPALRRWVSSGENGS